MPAKLLPEVLSSLKLDIDIYSYLYEIVTKIPKNLYKEIHYDKYGILTLHPNLKTVYELYIFYNYQKKRLEILCTSIDGTKLLSRKKFTVSSSKQREKVVEHSIKTMRELKS